MSDLISRQALCEYALNQKDKSVTPNDIMRFPSAQLATDINVGDTISRKMAIDAMKSISDSICEQQAIDALCELPPAQPQRKKGKWIDDDKLNEAIDGYYANCSLCGFEMDVHAEHGYFEYCPRCGARMDGESDETD